MATSATLRAVPWMDGVTFAGQDARLALTAGMLASAGSSGSTGIAARAGVRYGVGNPLAVLASSGMNITVNSGYVFPQGSAAIDAGIYAAVLDGTATLTVANADPTNARTDNVIVQIVDNGDNTSTYVAALQTGVPGAGAPTLPANSLLLAQIAVAAGAGSIVQGNITDKRAYTVAAGGIIPCASSSTYPTSGEASQYIHDLSTGRLRVLNGTGGTSPAKTAAWSPIFSTGVSNVTVSSTTTPVQVLAGTVTVDGVDVPRITCSWTSWSETTTAHGGDTLLHQIYRDGALVYQWYATVASGWPTSGRFPGGSFVFFDNAPVPATGTHTYAWKIISATSSATFRLDAGAQTQLSMSIEPAPR